MMLHRVLIAVLALTLCLAAPLVRAEGPGAPVATAPARPDAAALIAQWDAEASDVEQRLGSTNPGPKAIDAMRAMLEEQRAAVTALIADIDTRAEPLRGQLAALGPAPENPALDPTAIAADRARLTADIAAVEADQRRASQAGARATALLAQLAERRRILFTDTMLTRGPSPLDPSVIGVGLEAIGRIGSTIGGETAYRVRAQRMDADLLAGLVLPVLLIGAASFIILALQRLALGRLLAGVGSATGHSRRVAVAVSVTLVRLLLPASALVLASLGLYYSDLIGPMGVGVIRGLNDGLALVIGAYALSGAFFAPNAPHLRLSVLGDAQAVRAHRRVILLAALVGLDRALIIQGQVLGLAIEGLTLINGALLLSGGMALWSVIGVLTPRIVPVGAAPVEGEDAGDGDPGPAPLLPSLIGIARLTARLAAAAAPALALAGYYAASRYAFYPLVFSGALIALCILLFQVAQELVDTAAQPQGSGTRAGRIRLIPVIVGFLLFCVALPLLALIWGADTTDLSVVWRRISDGFAIGEVVVSPIDFLGFLLVFSAGYLMTRMAQGVLARSVLPLTGMDTGGRAAVNAGVGYFGIILAAVIAISTTGIDLSSLAIVAGALSVGIGFGLQNIVNNFVSGVILLIERPIKTGDWIELASGSGYVKQVNVRSTEIETFDRATLFVPNSELISGTVTNRTHNDLHGRIIVKVGVAYGTDPRKVERILLDIAKGHPMVLRRPAPFVLFRNLGAETLDFEIRAILRDVNWVLNVGSDINFEIASRFAAEGIVLPNPQRDLHLKNAAELGEAIGRAVGSSAREAGGPVAEPAMPEPPAPPDPRQSEDPESGHRGDPAPMPIPSSPVGPPRGSTDGDDPDPLPKARR